MHEVSVDAPVMLQILVAGYRLNYIIGMRIGNLNRPHPAILAPLAGVSNGPFRALAINAGAAMTFTEMVSSEGIIRNQKRTLSMMKFGSNEQPIAVQLFGANPDVMGRAAEITAKQFSPDLIDINFGCPARKVVRKNGGAAVLKDLQLTRDIITATVEGARSTPVSIKIRTGWDEDNPVHIEVGHIAQDCGAEVITLHARSRSSGFSGKADWSAIKALKEAVDIAVIGNGDIASPQDARRMFEETGCDAVMVGRAAMGNPFIFAQINHYLETGNLPDEPEIGDRIDMARNHARLVVQHFGEERGMKMMRRYLGWYVKGFRGASELRPRLFQVATLADMEEEFSNYISRASQW
ncbi:MAG: tRNA dihydrouridine synthase DusB [Candidatus Zixiibacteriota bacterium]|nr:MAG: tRNA dihydrouridine synthase DusB [candidate division Zixibacteria bacterium]